MNDSTKADGDEIDFPEQFLRDVDELAAKTDDGDAWDKLLYNDWFVCPTSRLADTLQISICRRRDYVVQGTDASDRLDVLVDSLTLAESSCESGFELPHISLRDLIEQAVMRFLLDSPAADGIIHANDREEALQLISDIEADFMAAIAVLRSKFNQPPGQGGPP
jgi:hypothetical protein